MRFTVRPTLAVTLVMVAVLAAGTTVAHAHEAIQPNEHFIGLVNGSNVEPVVYTVCPGPTWPGRTGPVAGGQTMSVAHVAAGPGYTGPLSQVYAWFDQDSSGTRPNMLKFTEYGAEQTIPTAVRVPCDGAGQAQFNPCPYLAPCVFGSSPDFVKVRFVNIAV